MDCGSLSAVTMMIGTVRVFSAALRAAATWKPSMSGICASSRMTSGGAAVAFSTALSPSSATTTR